MTLHQERTHPEYVPGCFGCKAGSVSFGTVPGARRDRETGISQYRQKEKDLHRYREKRRAGEQPDGTTRKAMERYERRVSSWEKTERELEDSTPTESFQKMKKTTLNGVV